MNKFNDLAANIAFSVNRTSVRAAVVTIILDQTDWIELLSLPEVDGDLCRNSELVQKTWRCQYRLSIWH